jgi:hypothetical protein
MCQRYLVSRSRWASMEISRKSRSPGRLRNLLPQWFAGSDSHSWKLGRRCRLQYNKSLRSLYQCHLLFGLCWRPQLYTCRISERDFILVISSTGKYPFWRQFENFELLRQNRFNPVRIPYISQTVIQN